MIQSLQRRMRDRNLEGGFTLIELMVVVMIIAILMTIAIPAFLGSRSRSQDSAAKSNVRNGLAAAQVIFSDDQAYPAEALLISTLVEDETSLSFVATASTGPKVISVDSADANTVVLASKSKSDKCFFLRRTATTTEQAEAPSSNACAAGTLLGVVFEDL